MTFQLEGEHTTAEVKCSKESVEENCLNQIQEMINHEAFQNSVIIQPDTHWGKGAVIGFTMPFEDRVVPNTVGVDIGCGMSAANFGYDCIRELEAKFGTMEEVDKAIRRSIPMGRNVHEQGEYHMRDDFPWSQLNYDWSNFLVDFGYGGRDDINYAPFGIDYFKDLCDRIEYDMGRAINSVGTLGGGNHFIEFNRSQETAGDIWCVIHSGSRGIGLSVAQHWQDKATAQTTARKNLDDVPQDIRPYLKEDWKPDADQIRLDFEGEEIQRTFDRVSQVIQEYGPSADGRNTDLDYLEGEQVLGYLRDMLFAQRYASENRRQMLELVSETIDQPIIEYLESVHNYIDFEDKIVRKGATRAHEGERVIVPFNMADGTIIIEGKGNPEWNYSAPHGAGRIMGRREAFRNLTVDDFKERMEGVHNYNDPEEILDEAPMAYKPIEIIMDVIEQTGKIVDTWKPVLNIKAEE